MTETTFTCPQCRLETPMADGLRFCPRCGRGVDQDDAEPMTISAEGRHFVVGGRLAFGDVANLYHCDIPSIARRGVLKIARTSDANRHLLHERDTLVRLRDADHERKYLAFLPQPLASVDYADDDHATPRRANVLAYHESVRSAGELYSLEDVRNAYPNGIDARDMAWMYRRLLTVLGYVHEQHVVHAAVTPGHVLIEPNEHKLILVGWCAAIKRGQIPILTPQRYRDWGGWSTAASPATDMRGASKTMSYLLAENVEPAIARHLERAAEASSVHAWKLLDDFDRLIEALWGPRQFRPFHMPGRG